MMKPKTFFLILIGFSFFGTLVAATGEYPWQLRKDREGIRVSTRSVKDSPIYELRGEMTISVSLEKVTALYEKVEQMLKWFHRAKEVKLIQNISKNESIIYFAADLPWPLSDRDGVYRRVKSIDAATGAVIYTMTYAGPDLYPKQKDRVRVVYLDAEWKFTPLAKDQTQIFYRMHTEAGGYIPPLIVNTFTVSLPFRTLQKFRALALSEKSK